MANRKKDNLFCYCSNFLRRRSDFRRRSGFRRYFRYKYKRVYNENDELPSDNRDVRDDRDDDDCPTVKFLLFSIIYV